MYDHLTDTSLQTLHTLSKQFVDGNLPSFVKAANVSAERPDASMPSSAYGDPVAKRLPCHSKVATWLSSLYFWGQRANGENYDGSMPADKISDRLEKASKFWGIYPEIVHLQQQIATKSAAVHRKLTDNDYALVVNYGSERVRRFPVVNAATVEKAAESLHKFCANYPYPWRQKAARQVLKKMMEFDARDIAPEHLDYLYKASGVYPESAEVVAEQLQIRGSLYPDEVKPSVKKAVAALRSGADANMEKMCRIIDSLDRHYKTYTLYSGGMPKPEEVCFVGPTVKYASNGDAVQLTTGQSYSIEAIKEAGLEPFTVLDNAYMTAIVNDDKGDIDTVKAAQVLPTIPRNDATLLEKSLAAVGVNPMSKEARGTRPDQYSMKGLMDFFGNIDRDFSGSSKLNHGQGVHDELDDKNRNL